MGAPPHALDRPAVIRLALDGAISRFKFGPRRFEHDLSGSKTHRAHAVALLALLALAGCGQGAKSGAQPRETPSGLPVPRYVSLKFDEVNARGGPGDDFRLLWVYRARGLPVQVTEETKEWRRVCDPMGGLAWVKATGVDGARTAIRLQPTPVSLYDKPQSGAKVSAVLAGRAVARLDRCKGGWCRLKAKGGSGWAPADALWGTDDRLQCH
jgi:SH3-like domain-containing protein